ncbi:MULTISPECIES: DUF3757 domain-containing protein [Pseudomonas]|jgi:hypothetical protein|uniref:DUF3757 domain-containing protein n=1 Tax=Pseudomonas orientalis TaxID=76758 RepID=A0A4Q7D666_9PSED|nr:MULTISPECIES: DUF3757 domain-containing protein [Pseudomonas]POM11321.1 DUF3757 domain-containing protein [Pseudomonas sp. WP001]MBY8931792.1 DUF3757 domain-containing protein [Pseudomonas sp. Wu6]RZI33568.1 DUF3757 domain-containing protein [Pseudomonas orientalis]CRM45653.1 hypothetical protein [Pseudomonas sp. 44 R 15]CRM74648.1 hypothetical protein [Pseudomonas sp. 24 E 13]
MLKHVMCMLVLVVCMAGQAQGNQFCPDKSKIQTGTGYFQYQASGVLWQGPKVEPGEFIHAFSGAVFAPQKGDDRRSGLVEKCVYTNQRDELVVLRPCLSDVASSMSLADSLHWERENTSFDQLVYLCKENQPGNCAFNVKDNRR